MLSQTFECPPHSSWGASKRGNSLWASQFTAVDTESRALLAQHQAGPAPSTGGTNKGPAAEDPHTGAGLRSHLCSSSEHRAQGDAGYSFICDSYSGEIKLRNMTTIGNVARKC